MIVVLAPDAVEGYLKLENAGEETGPVDEFLEILDRTLPREFGDAAANEFHLGRFRVHRLRGALAGWWSAEMCMLSNGRPLLVVFYAEGHKIGVAAISEHDEAYRTAKLRRAGLARKPARRRALHRRIR